MREIITHLAFEDRAEEAVRFYTSVIPDSRITGITRFRADEPGPEGEVRTIRFEMLGRKYLAVNGGPEFSFTEGTSLLVQCDTQTEIDRLWQRLGDGGQTQVCGWLTDRYGLAWQITAAVAEDFIYGPDPEGSQRVVEATYRMTKIDIAALERAYRGEADSGRLRRPFGVDSAKPSTRRSPTSTRSRRTPRRCSRHTRPRTGEHRIRGGGFQVYAGQRLAIRPIGPHETRYEQPGTPFRSQIFCSDGTANGCPRGPPTTRRRLSSRGAEEGPRRVVLDRSFECEDGPARSRCREVRGPCLESVPKEAGYERDDR